MKVRSPWKAGDEFTGDPKKCTRKWSAQVFILFKIVSSTRIWGGGGGEATEGKNT